MLASRVLPVALAVALVGWSMHARADEPTAAPPAGSETPATVRPAQVTVDAATGAQSVLVPRGCTPVRQTSGQLVVLCPYAAPKLEAPVVQAAASAPAPAKATRTEWYGWQILLGDGASLASGIATGLLSEPGTGAAVGLTGYALGAPVVHWSHGQVGQGFGSLALRVGTPVSLAFWSFLAFGLSGSDADTATLAAGASAVLGMGAAMIVDVAVLAHEKVPTEATQARTKPEPSLRWTPTAGYDGKRNALTVGLSGSF